MAITSAICNSFKTEILQGGHNFNDSSGAPTGNTFKISLYTDAATLSKSTTAYTAPADGTADPTNTYEHKLGIISFFYSKRMFNI